MVAGAVKEDLGRRRRGASALVAAGIWLATTAATPALAAPGSVQAEFFGMSTVGAKGRDFPRMAQGGTGTYRTVVPWSEVKGAAAGSSRARAASASSMGLPLPDLGGLVDPGDSDDSGGGGGGKRPVPGYHWGHADFGILNAATSGMEPLGVLYGSPKFVARDPRTPPLGSNEARLGWQAFVRAAVGRYGPGGELWRLNPDVPYRPVRVWQVWNEQNAAYFWHGSRPSVTGYLELLRLTHQAIREADPGAEVVLGGMYGYPTGRRSIKMKRFLARLYASGPVHELFDGVAVHPYGEKVRAVKRQIRDARTIMNRNGDSATPIWVTEIGWATDGPRKWDLVTSRKGQARKLRGAYRMLLRKRSTYGIRNVTWFSWRDFKDEACGWCGASGLFTRAGKPKPAWRRYVKLTGGAP